MRIIVSYFENCRFLTAGVERLMTIPGVRSFSVGTACRFCESKVLTNFQVNFVAGSRMHDGCGCVVDESCSPPPVKPLHRFAATTRLRPTSMCKSNFRRRVSRLRPTLGSRPVVLSSESLPSPRHIRPSRGDVISCSGCLVHTKRS
jgi:hypothetical protein